MAEQPHPAENTGRVVIFRPRPPRPLGGDRHSGNAKSQGWRQLGVAGLAKYEQTEGADDYRHRMIVNVIAFVFIVMLTAAGIWLAEALSAMRKHQDCVLSGRRDCATIHTRDR
jgi:hypothetical protein